MKISKSQNGFTLIMGLLIVVLVAAIGFAGWKVYDTSKSTKSVEASSTAPVAKKTEPVISDSIVEYQNKDLGFKFAYPKAWGEVVLKDFANQVCSEQIQNVRDKVHGNNYQLNFANNKDKVVTLVTKDFKLDLQIKCAISLFNFYYSDLAGKGFRAENGIEYVVAEDAFESCHGSNYYLFGLVPLKNSKLFDGMSVQLHSSVASPTNETSQCGVPQDPAAAQLKAILNDEDKKLMSTFTTL